MSELMKEVVEVLFPSLSALFKGYKWLEEEDTLLVFRITLNEIGRENDHVRITLETPPGYITKHRMNHKDIMVLQAPLSDPYWLVLDEIERDGATFLAYRAADTILPSVPEKIDEMYIGDKERISLKPGERYSLKLRPRIGEEAISEA